MNADFSATMISPLARPRLTDLVKSYLIELIFNNSLSIGDELPSEGELARTLQVSKSVVREAIRELSALSLIETRQGKPTAIKGLTSQPLEFLFEFASRTSEQGFRDLLELRRAIECEAACEAALRRDTHHLDGMRDAIKGLRDHIENVEKGAQADWEFHRILVDASGNDLFRCIFLSLEKPVSEMQRRRRIDSSRAELEAKIELHVAVLDAIEAQDAGRAGAAMATHFSTSAESLAKLVAR